MSECHLIGFCWISVFLSSFLVVVYSHLNTWFNFFTFLFRLKTWIIERTWEIYTFGKNGREIRNCHCVSEIWCFKHAFFFVSLITLFYMYNPRTPFLACFSFKFVSLKNCKTFLFILHFNKFLFVKFFFFLKRSDLSPTNFFLCTCVSVVQCKCVGVFAFCLKLFNIFSRKIRRHHSVLPQVRAISFFFLMVLFFSFLYFLSWECF